jgi:hypothetical protein
VEYCGVQRIESIPFMTGWLFPDRFYTFPQQELFITIRYVLFIL